MLKVIKIKLKLNPCQKLIINELIDTSNYVYNKTLEYTKNGYKPNFINLRNILVTEKSKINDDLYRELTQNIRNLKLDKKQLEEIKSQRNKEKEDIRNGKKKRKVKKRNEISDEELESKIKAIDEDINVKKIQFSQAEKEIASVKNLNINEWELKTPKAIRSFAVQDVCDAYKSSFSNLKKGNIKYFEMNYRKHFNRESCITIPKQSITFCEDKNKKHVFNIFKTFFNKEDVNINIGKRKIKQNLVIDHDCKLIRKNNEYWICCPVDVTIKDDKQNLNYCGVDPGIRTFMTTFGNNGVFEYNHNKTLLDKLNKQIYYIREKRNKNCNNKFIGLRKREAKKENLVNELHWKTIHHLLSSNDVIMYGDIKSHNIVKNKKNKILNRNVNDLKFYSFKSRLLYKAKELNKLVFQINEAYTSQCCSNCGSINKPGKSKVYNCSECKITYDRDANAAKNILIKGISTCL